MKFKFSDDEFRKAVSESVSIRQVLIKFGFAPNGGNYQTIIRRIKRLNISTDHFLGKGSNKGQNFGPKRPISDYLSNKYNISSFALKRRLISEGYFQRKCYNCNNTHWLEKPIPLEIEHKDGNHQNNNLDNLTLLCPNCHSLTPTYRRRKSSLKA